MSPCPFQVLKLLEWIPQGVRAIVDSIAGMQWGDIEPEEDEYPPRLCSGEAQGISSAEQVLSDFVVAKGGTVATIELVELYHSEPWLADAVGRLCSFCSRSAKLVYQARTALRPAFLAVADTVAMPTACVLEEEEEEYQPRWMSRKVLKAQVRRQLRPWPKGFNPRRRTDRRAKALDWLQGFLEVFSPDVACEAEGLLRATRRWPQNDENQSRDNTTSDAVAQCGAAGTGGGGATQRRGPDAVQKKPVEQHLLLKGRDQPPPVPEAVAAAVSARASSAKALGAALTATQLQGGPHQNN